MGTSECCVTGCGQSSHDHQGMKRFTGLTFHCFPAWRTNEGGYISELTQKRRKAWVSAVARGDVTFDYIPPFMRVCSRHFYSGKPAFEVHDSDPDWVPSLYMNEEDSPSQSYKERQNELGEEDAAHTDQPVTGQRPYDYLSIWREAAILLRGHNPNQPQNEDQNQPTDENATNFRNFFRNSLEASLEASIRSRARSTKQSSSAGNKEKPNLRLPPDNVEQSSSSCLNCAQLRVRIQELEKTLFHLTMEQQGPIEDEMDLDNTKEVEEENFKDEYVSPEGFVFEFADGDSDYTSNFTGWFPPACSSPSTAQTGRIRRSLRFRTQWLNEFPFLRYSQSQNLMWCHVCRALSGDNHPKLAMIRGSRIFKKHCLRTHSQSKHHLDNMERYSWSSQL